jgi:IS605 OrfB family transposase
MTFMDRAITFELNDDEDSRKTIEEYNQACNECLQLGFKKKTWNKNIIHKKTYSKIREKYELQSSLVCASRDQASEMLKREKCKRLPFKKRFSSIRYNVRTFWFKTKEQLLSYSTINGRKEVKISIPKYFKPYLKGKVKAMTLSYRNGKLRGQLIVELPDVKKLKVKKVLGIDRGILFPVVTSDNNFFDSKKLRRIKGKYQYLKSQLQSKGTRSAKRHLKVLSGKEKRFVRDMNHTLSKKIANMPYEAFAIEKLELKRKKSNGKRFNKKLGSWATRQLENFVVYKVEGRGKTILYVKPNYTSQVCSSCGRKNKSNRKGRNYCCDRCGFVLHADLNASRNIAELGKSQISRLSFSKPIVASLMESYKPLDLSGGN